jgi:hypothetical protein
MSARRLRNVVIEAFATRYLREDGQPARILKAMSGRIPVAELRQLLFLYACRANPILADFVRNVYWDRYAAGGKAVTKEEAQSFVPNAYHCIFRDFRIRTQFGQASWGSTSLKRQGWSVF